MPLQPIVVNGGSGTGSSHLPKSLNHHGEREPSENIKGLGDIRD